MVEPIGSGNWHGRAHHRTRTKRVQMDHGLAMIIVDYLQLLAPSKRKENREQEVSEISRELKILAKELNVPVIALSQLSREVERRSPPVPMLSDLRNSGSLGQDADLVIFIYRGDLFEPNTGGIARLLIAKNRHGPTGTADVVFDNTFVRFDDLARPHQVGRADLRGRPATDQVGPTDLGGRPAADQERLVREVR